MKSERGIYYDLKESDYTYTIDNFEFVFSSLFYLKLFKYEIEKDIKFEEDKLSNKFKNRIHNFKDFILLERYRNIEKRGFLVYYKNKELKDYAFSVNLETR